MTTVYFGPRWDAPLLDDPTDGSPGPVQVPTPVGEYCYVCGEAFIEEDRGLVRLGVEAGFDRALAGRRMLVHVECEMLGTIGHLYGVCTCTGWDTTTRAAALELLRVLNEGRAGQGMGPL